MKIYGYELLYRKDYNAVQYENPSPTSATAVVLEGLFEQGIEKITDNEKAFVNFDYDFIMSEAIELINPDILVIEVLETVEVDDPLLSRLLSLSKKGYKIALDDFEGDICTYPAVPIADIIKYDILINPLEAIESEVEQALSQKKILLAEKIETEADFQKAKAMGFHLFQGYFFSKPKIIGSPSIPISSNVNYSRIINELKTEEPSFDVLVRIIESDVNLSYRLVRVVSSKKDENTLSSIRNALLRMGLKEIERWIYILMMQDFAKGKPAELMKLSLVRSEFGGFIAQNSRLKKRKDEISMMCLFSLLDVLLEKPMSKALEGMLFTDDVFRALVHGEGPLQPILPLITAYERGEWNRIGQYAGLIGANIDRLPKGYLDAISWTAGIFAALD